jgi:hypothetical protein
VYITNKCGYHTQPHIETKQFNFTPFTDSDDIDIKSITTANPSASPSDTSSVGYVTSALNMLSKLSLSFSSTTASETKSSSSSVNHMRVVNANTHETSAYSWMDQCAIRWIEVTGRVYESKCQPSVALAFYKVYVFNGGNIDPVHLERINASTTSNGTFSGAVGDITDPRYVNILKTDRTVFSNIVVSPVDVYSKLVLKVEQTDDNTFGISRGKSIKPTTIMKVNKKRLH